MSRATDAALRARTMLVGEIGGMARYACGPAFSRVNLGNPRHFPRRCWKRRTASSGKLKAVDAAAASGRQTATARSGLPASASANAKLADRSIITQADRLFFERRPDRQHRVRLASQAESTAQHRYDSLPPPPVAGCTSPCATPRRARACGGFWWRRRGARPTWRPRRGISRLGVAVDPEVEATCAGWWRGA
jgi:hypothetical protein